MPGQSAAAVKRDPLADPDDVEDARLLSEDLQSTLAIVRYVAISWEDAAALYKAATRRRAAGWLAPDVTLRVAAALADMFAAESGLRADQANAVPSAETGIDHGGKSILTGGDSDPDPP